MQKAFRALKDNSALTPGLLGDFMNFFPNWHAHISHFIKLEVLLRLVQVDSAGRLESVF